MKLNWFSPLPPKSTDIAHYTKRILSALAERTEVVLWTNQGRIDREIRQNFEVRRFAPGRVAWDALNRADATVYNIGNDPRFHAAIWEVSRRHPGIVILHDASLQHLFGGVFLNQRRDPSQYLQVMRNYYGTSGRRAAQDYLDHEDKDSFILYLSANYPLTGLALRGALGAITHTRQVYERLRHQQPCVCAYVPLPYPALDDLSRPDERLTVHTKIRRLIVFGYLGPNRRLESLLGALAGMSEKNDFRLDVYGQLWDAAHVHELIHRYELTKQVKLRGFVSEDELEAALESSDLGINLRYPTMGEASGSQLRLWSHSLPSLVTDIDWYATLPRDAVAHVSVEHEVADIQKHLRDLLDSPERFKQIGERGRRVLIEEHAPSAYVASLMDLLALLPAMRSRRAAFHFTERAAREIALWEAADNLDPTSPLIQKAALEAHLLMSDKSLADSAADSE